MAIIQQTDKEGAIQMNTYSTDKVTSADGTTIGYRRYGSGPALVLVHGGMNASQNFSRLAELLADIFTVYVPDRRGRGMSGPHGDAYCLDREVEDMQAVIHRVGARQIFGLSSGAIITAQTALSMPQQFDKVALYEPPLPVGNESLTGWLPQFEAHLAKGDLAAAIVTILKATGDPSLMLALPSFVLTAMFRRAIAANASRAAGDDVPLKDLIPTMRFDARLVIEMQDQITRFKDLKANVLLIGGTQSRDYLKAALDKLQSLLPNAQRITLDGLGHIAATNRGQPERVAVELRRFFLEI